MLTTLEAPPATSSLTVAPPVRSPAPPITARAHFSECLTFRVGNEEYGIDILKVQELRRFQQPTRIACSRPHVLGVVNLRGAIVPILDLRRRLGSDTSVSSSTVVIVLSLDRRVIGVVVDAVADVIELARHQLLPVPAMAGSLDPSFINGIASVDDRMVILVNIEALVGDVDLDGY